ncbi:MAG: rRNA maturation RNase YbeY [Acholeplasmataceae bacterium]
MRVNIHDRTGQKSGRIRRLIRKVFAVVSDTSSFELILVDDAEIRRLNRDYRAVDRVTDVLSFPNEDDGTSLGDVFIDLEQAKRQAQDYGHGFDREVGFLAVHGYLHLKGYDHLTEEGERAMVLEQERILKKAKLERMTK